MKTKKRIINLLLATVMLVFSIVSFNFGTVNAEGAVTITSVTIQGNNLSIAVTGTVPSEDGMFHLIASAASETAPSGTEVATQSVGTTSFTVPFDRYASNTLLYKKFTVCVLSGGAYVPVSNSMYILNPESGALASPARMDNGIKGIFPEVGAVADLNHLPDLGISQVNINVPISKLAVLGVYDSLVQKYNALGIQVNMILLADAAAGTDYISPLSYQGMNTKNSSYFAFNVSSPEACERIGNAAATIASRYSGIGYGQVDNFIIGNEVNAWRAWNYLKFSTNDEYVNEYYKAFRVMYNGIKSANGNANVYTCIDHQWASPEASYYMAGKEFLTRFNTFVTTQGNIDYRVAVHPNNYWLLATKAWETNSKVTHSQNSKYLTMVNFYLLTDFLSSADMLSPTGAVRSVKISELGYSSHKGENDQAASVVFAYLVASNNSHVDGIVIHREADSQAEIKQGIKGGICNVDGSPKKAYTFYKNPLDPSVIAQASSIAGVDLTSMINAR